MNLDTYYIFFSIDNNDDRPYQIIKYHDDNNNICKQRNYLHIDKNRMCYVKLNKDFLRGHNSLEVWKIENKSRICYYNHSDAVYALAHDYYQMPGPHKFIYEIKNPLPTINNSIKGFLKSEFSFTIDKVELTDKKSYEVWSDNQLCIDILKNNGFQLKYVPKDLQTYEMCENAIKNTGYAIEYANDKYKTSELCIIAIKCDEKLLNIIPNNLKEDDTIKDIINKKQKTKRCKYY